MASLISTRISEKFIFLSALYFTVCENHVLELEKTKDNIAEIRYYFRAEADGLTYLEGLEKVEDSWYSLPVSPVEDPKAEVQTEITEQQAQAIIASYVPLETQPERQQMKRYGEPVKPIPSWTDPYAMYIAEALEWLEDAGKLTYTLMDLNGDGIQELIARDVWTMPRGCTEPEYELSVHTIVDGELELVTDYSMTGVCEGGILMYGEEDGTHYEFYRMKGTELELIEMIYQDRVSKYWVRAVKGENPQTSNCSEETARSYIAQYHPIELNMKPFSEYPFS